MVIVWKSLDAILFYEPARPGQLTTLCPSMVRARWNSAGLMALWMLSWWPEHSPPVNIHMMKSNTSGPSLKWKQLFCPPSLQGLAGISFLIGLRLSVPIRNIRLAVCGNGGWDSSCSLRSCCFSLLPEVSYYEHRCSSRAIVSDVTAPGLMIMID